MNRKTHKEFIEEVADASSLPAQTSRALAPESQEDIVMYANYSDDEIKKGTPVKKAGCFGVVPCDAVYTEGEKQ